MAQPLPQPGIKHRVRPATTGDLDAIARLEEASFRHDRLNRRRIRYLLTRARAQTLVAEAAGTVVGYVMVLFNRATAHGRVYSIAVDHRFRKHGLGATLLHAAEKAAAETGCASMRLEVRKDNAAAIALYREQGYRPFETVIDYYEDHEPALRFEKTITPEPAPQLTRVPYYAQTLDFTCGPASLMMAMKTLDPRLRLSRELELTLWRESTTVFMTSGIGGCTPFGLALAAVHRGFGAELFTTAGRNFFADSVRSPVKKEVIRLVQEGFIRELKQLRARIHRRALRFSELQERIDTGRVPVVLISSYRIYGEKSPHWVVVTGYDERFIYVHDPFIDKAEGETVVDSLNMPILHREFERMTRYGRAGLKAVLFVGRPGGPGPGARDG